MEQLRDEIPMVNFFRFAGTLSLIFTMIPVTAAQQGCCSWHGGVNYCGSDGYYMCNDGTRSPSCTCEYESLTSQAFRENLEKLGKLTEMVANYGPSSICSLLPSLRNSAETMITTMQNTLQKFQSMNICGVACADLQGAINQDSLFVNFINDHQQKNCISSSTPSLKSKQPKQNIVSAPISKKSAIKACKRDKDGICQCPKGFKITWQGARQRCSK